METVQKENYFRYIPLLLALYLSWQNRNFYFEDALIYARYINNLLDGYGLVYNRGELFNGLTSPLFTYLSVIATYLVQDTIFAINLLSGVFFILTLYVYQHIFSSAGNATTAFLGSLLVVLSPFMYLVFGMETFLFVFLIGLSIHLFLTERYHALLITLALLILTRSEGVFLVAALVFEHFRLKRAFPKLTYFILPSIMVIAHFAFTYYYYGAFMPATGKAKIWQGESGLWGESNVIFLEGGVWLFKRILGSKFLIGLFILLSIVGGYRVGRKSLNYIVVVFVLLLLGFYTLLNIPNYHWYDAPFLVFLFYYAALGIKVSYEYFISKVERRAAKNIILALYLITVSYYLVDRASRIKHNETHYFLKASPPYKEIATWLKSNTAEDASVAMVEIGVIGYFSERYIVDILGLVNPYNAQFIGERELDKWLTKYHPDYILVHEKLWPHEISAKKAVNEEGYLEYTKFNIPGFRLLASKHLNLPSEFLVNPYLSK